MTSSTSLLGPTTFSILIFLNCFFVVVTSQQNIYLQRQLRQFPYSMSFYKMLGYDRQLSPYYGVNDEIAALIDSMNNEENTFSQRLRRSPQLQDDEISSIGHKWKRYACRFKFCRIY